MLQMARASLGELPKGQLHVVHGLTDEEEEGEVADEEAPTTIAIGKGRKSPNISDANGEPDTAEDEFPL